MVHSSVHSPPSVAVAPAEADTLDLSVIIVNYNVREFLEQALRSVQRACGDLSVEVFVVDNNSVDGSTDMVRVAFPEVHLIANEHNVGFGAANNQALRQAVGRYALILNPDTIVQEDTFSTLIAFMEAHPEAGAVGCKIMNPDGTFAPESRRSFPTPLTAFFRIVGFSRLFPKSRLFGRYNMTYLPPEEAAEVDALSGSCMMVRRSALYYGQQELAALRAAGEDPNLGAASDEGEPPRGAGLFDENFFMYGEDLDWCCRIQQAGWQIHYTPDTQIIHYKGESTKKGELRYVKLFYGAMLRFAEKHLHTRYSRLFIWLLRVGVFVRAGIMVMANALRRLAAPLLDFALVLSVVALLGFLRSLQVDVVFSPLFYGLVAPLYALSTVGGLALMGSYRRSRRAQIRPVWVGAGLGLLLISAASFFAKDIAFSRVVVLLGYPISAALLSILRPLRAHRPQGPRHALLIGPQEEALRLHTMLHAHPEPPFELTGYVASEDTSEEERDVPLATPVPQLGHLRHLRDLVRLRQIHDVVFAADGLSNRLIFRLMHQLRDLPVQFRILAEGREHIIGKASIDDLSTPSLIEAEEALGPPRSPVARRAFEESLALLGLLLHPLLWLAGKLTGASSFCSRLAHRTGKLPSVLRGDCALIGYHPEEPFRPPPEWDLRPGIFSITDTLTKPDLTPQEINRYYWFYVRNQSASLDWTILLRALAKLI